MPESELSSNNNVNNNTQFEPDSPPHPSRNNRTFLVGLSPYDEDKHQGLWRLNDNNSAHPEGRASKSKDGRSSHDSLWDRNDNIRLSDESLLEKDAIRAPDNK